MSSLARQLVLDEIFDLALYRALRGVARGRQRDVLDELIEVETRHVGFWQEFFALEKQTRLDLGRRLKLRLLVAACRVFGAGAIQLVLEAIQVHGVRKYLSVWRRFRAHPLGGAVRGILEEEFGHEGLLVAGAGERRVNPERVRNVFLGLNDGLVEIVGAVSGFFAAFGNPVTVLAAGVTVAVAGSLSMAAGAYIAAGSERELRADEDERKRFLGEEAAGETGEGPLAAALVVGLGYAAGALVPIVPILLGAPGMLPTILAAAAVIVAASAVVAFLSGMDVRRRIALNLAVTALAVVVTYGIGLAAKAAFGVSV
jgi:VIT1/CCC1 family predicted Fe2+/Mn2+ transporter